MTTPTERTRPAPPPPPPPPKPKPPKEEKLEPIPFTAKEISEKLGVPLENVEKYAPALASAMKDAGITDEASAIALLATIKVETGVFAPIPEIGGGVASNPSGGNRYMGRGFIQLTHDYNYEKYGNKLGVDLLNNPDRALEPEIAAGVMVEYFKDHGIPAMAQAGDWRGVRKSVNGGYNGWDVFSEAVSALKGGAPLPMNDSPVPTSSPSGSSSGSSSGGPSGSADTANLSSGGGRRSGMSLPGASGRGPASSPGGNFDPVRIPGFDWDLLIRQLMDGGIAKKDAEAVLKAIKSGDKKGAMEMLKGLGLSKENLDAAIKAVESAPAMGAAHEQRNDWFISQYGGKFNTNEDLPGSENGNCGPTSLTMVAKAFGKINPTAAQADGAIEESRSRMGDGNNERMGTSVAGIARGAKSYGLDAKIRSDANLETIQQELAQGRLVIAHTSALHLTGRPGGGHYCVVTAIEGDKVYLNDPAKKEGPVVLSAAEFMASIRDRGTHAMVSIGP